MGPAPDRYARAAAGWVDASRVYRPLAEELVRRSPVPVAGHVVLDVGTGTGVVGDALTAAGATVLAVDRSPDMLAWRSKERPPAAVADVLALPVSTGAVDAAVAAFVLNHLTEPDGGLRELVRVVRPGGVVLATVYSNASRSAVRDRLDEEAIALGYRVPDWYVELKSRATPMLGSALLMAEAAETAGLVDLEVTEEAVDVGIGRAADLVDYRFGQAHYTEWLASLGAAERARARRQVIAAIEPLMAPYRPTVVFLAARTPG